VARARAPAEAAMSSLRLLAMVGLAVITRASVVAANSYALPDPFVSGTPMTLGPDATLYLFVPSVTEPALRETVTATQGTTQLVVEIEEVGRSPAGSVKRLRIRGLAPGEVSLAFRHESTTEWTVADRAPARAWPHVRGVEHNGPVGECQRIGPRFELAGDRAAAFRLRWVEAGTRREVYLPASAVTDVDGIPIRGVQSVLLGAGCGVNWLGVDPAVLDTGEGTIGFEDAELTMLGVDGDETVVLRGVIAFDRGELTVASFALRPLPPPPPVVEAPPPTPAPAVVRWRVAAATSGGLTLGAAAGFFAFGRRRRAT